MLSRITHRSLVYIAGPGDEADEADLFRQRMSEEEVANFADRYLAGAIQGKPVDARADRGEGDSSDVVCGGEAEAVAIARSQQLVLATVASAPDRADRVNHVLGRQVIAASDPCFTGRAAAECAALLHQPGSRRPMNRAVHAATAQQRGVCRV